MTAPKWYAFDSAKGSRQKRPPEGKAVLVFVELANAPFGRPHAICVGYRKNAAGDKQSPYFVIPGHGGKVLSWCDCLPEPTNVFGLWQTARKAGGVPLV